MKETPLSDKDWYKEIEPYGKTVEDRKRVIKENVLGLGGLSQLAKGEAFVDEERREMMDYLFPNWDQSDFKQIYNQMLTEKKKREVMTKMVEICNILGIPNDSDPEKVSETVQELVDVLRR